MDRSASRVSGGRSNIDPLVAAPAMLGSAELVPDWACDGSYCLLLHPRSYVYVGKKWLYYVRATLLPPPMSIIASRMLHRLTTPPMYVLVVVSAKNI